MPTGMLRCVSLDSLCLCTRASSLVIAYVPLALYAIFKVLKNPEVFTSVLPMQHIAISSILLLRHEYRCSGLSQSLYLILKTWRFEECGFWWGRARYRSEVRPHCSHMYNPTRGTGTLTISWSRTEPVHLGSRLLVLKME